MEEQLEHTKTPTHNKRSRQFNILSALILFFAAIALVAIFTSNDKHAASPARIATIRITKSGFEPATLSVKQGTKVIWTNSDDTLHQVAANPYPKGTDLKNLKSEILNNAQSYTYVADTAGSFGYHDQLAPTINGTLVVQKR